MKDIISKLQQKMEEADRTEREADQVNTRGESAGCSSNEKPSANSPRNWGKKLRS